MNRCYRVIFNHSLGVWQCVSELAKAKGKSKSFKALAVAVAVAMSGEVGAVDYVVSGNETFLGSGLREVNSLTVSGSASAPATLHINLSGNLDETGVQSTNDIKIGDNGVGTISIEGGQLVTGNINNGFLHNTGAIKLGVSSINSQGTINIESQEVTTKKYPYLKTKQLIIGETGTGVVTLKDLLSEDSSGMTYMLYIGEIGQVVIGDKDTATGTLTIQKAGLNSIENVVVGNQGSGTLTIQNGI